MDRTKFLAMCLAVVLGLAWAPLTHADGLRVKVSSDPWEPWVLGPEGGEATGGIGVDIARELFKRIGLDSEIRIYPYERCLRQMQSGERDVLLMAKKTPEREKFMLFSDVAVIDPQRFYYSVAHMDDFQWEDWQDLKPFTVGGVQGFNYGDFTTAAEKLGVTVELVASDAQNIRKLLAGRINLVILNESTANYYMNQNPEFRGKIRAATKNVSAAEFHIALSRNGKAGAYLDAINQALSSMQADGSINRIFSAYQ